MTLAAQFRLTSYNVLYVRIVTGNSLLRLLKWKIKAIAKAGDNACQVYTREALSGRSFRDIIFITSNQISQKIAQKI
jgi:hypothetical protein